MTSTLGCSARQVVALVCVDRLLSDVWEWRPEPSAHLLQPIASVRRERVQRRRDADASVLHARMRSYVHDCTCVVEFVDLEKFVVEVPYLVVQATATGVSGAPSVSARARAVRKQRRRAHVNATIQNPPSVAIHVLASPWKRSPASYKTVRSAATGATGRRGRCVRCRAAGVSGVDSARATTLHRATEAPSARATPRRSTTATRRRVRCTATGRRGRRGECAR